MIPYPRQNPLADEKLQVGGTDEGADALAEIVDMVRTEERADARHAVRAELVDMRLKSENDAALGKFAKRYPALTKEPVLVEAAAHVLRDELARDLKAAGMSDDEINPIREDVGRLAGLHGKARVLGGDVRSPDKLLISGDPIAPRLASQGFSRFEVAISPATMVGSAPTSPQVTATVQDPAVADDQGAKDYSPSSGRNTHSRHAGLTWACRAST